MTKNKRSTRLVLLLIASLALFMSGCTIKKANDDKAVEKGKDLVKEDKVAKEKVHKPLPSNPYIEEYYEKSKIKKEDRNRDKLTFEQIDEINYIDGVYKKDLAASEIAKKYSESTSIYKNFVTLDHKDKKKALDEILVIYPKLKTEKEKEIMDEYLDRVSIDTDYLSIRKEFRKIKSENILNNTYVKAYLKEQKKDNKSWREFTDEEREDIEYIKKMYDRDLSASKISSKYSKNKEISENFISLNVEERKEALNEILIIYPELKTKEEKEILREYMDRGSIDTDYLSIRKEFRKISKN